MMGDEPAMLVLKGVIGTLAFGIMLLIFRNVKHTDEPITEDIDDAE